MPLKKGDLSPKISVDRLQELSEWITARMGLHFPKDRWRSIEKAVIQAAHEFGFDDEEECIHWLLKDRSGKEQIEALAGYLTVGETFFFRDVKTFTALEEQVLRPLIEQRRSSGRVIRIWSAACASGEEPYSLAMLLERMLPDLKNWVISLVATDINPRCLEKASTGVYKDWSFRGSPKWLKEHYFTKLNDNQWQVVQRIREMVTFSYHNLVEDPYPSLLNNTNALDLILCRNVLMYFTEEWRRTVVSSFSRCIVDGGWLLVSPTEATLDSFNGYTRITFPGTILFRKQTQTLTGDSPARPREGMSLPLPEAEPRPKYRPAKQAGTTIPKGREGPGADHRAISRGAPAADGFDRLYDRAMKSYEAGLYAEAVRTLSSGMETAGPDDESRGKAAALLARALANEGRLAEAADRCAEAVTIDKVNAAYRYLYATILQEQGKAIEAATFLRQAIYLDQGFVLAHFALGNLVRQLGNPQESARHFKNALELLKGYPVEAALPHAEGLTARRLAEIIRSTEAVDVSKS